MKKYIYSFIAITSLLLVGCSNNDTPFEEAPLLNSNESNQVMKLIASLPEGDSSDSRLTYEEVTVSGKKGLKTRWSESDNLVANALPSSKEYVYLFELEEGNGSSTATFTCKNGYPTNFSTNAWTLYYPGNITCEQDYLNFTYTGQVQNGNGDTQHLTQFHTMRLPINDGTQSTFNGETHINFSGDNLEQSACMKFNLSGLPSIKPTNISLTYLNESGSPANQFYTHNCLDEWWGTQNPNRETVSTLSLALENFTQTSTVTAYMMMSNYPTTVKAGAKFKVTVTDNNGKKYYCEKAINKNTSLLGGHLHSITCTEWEEAGTIDGFDNSATGVQVLQEKSVGNGTDIIIMGDGFAADQFGTNGINGNYNTIMRQAYEDFFSVQPYTALKDYFNVYYINAVSEDNHDATPYWSEGTPGNGSQNGATMGSASTKFSSTFVPNSTHIEGNNDLALAYAMQAIRTKGGLNGTACTDENEVYTRAHKALILMMVNVKCYAGTCAMSWTQSTTDDYGNSYSVAYTALGYDETGGQCKWTTIHEGGGHGFGKLADEYGGGTITEFGTGNWVQLSNKHTYGVHRNVNEHWTQEEINDGWSSSFWATTTTPSNVYWAELLSNSYAYSDDITPSGKAEGLGIYRGGYTYNNLFCRPTENSIMRSQFDSNGQFFNAISRWAIWYRVMRLTGSTSATNFKSSLDEFIAFDNTLTIEKNQTTSARGISQPLEPLAPPIEIVGRWENGRFITE